MHGAQTVQGKISKTQVDRLRAGEILADGDVRGFVARKLASGVVTFGFRYRDRLTGKQRWYRLGLHGNITAEQARTLAKKAAGQVADKLDPVGEQQEARAEAKKVKQADANTVDAILDAFGNGIPTAFVAAIRSSELLRSTCVQIGPSRSTI